MELLNLSVWDIMFGEGGGREGMELLNLSVWDLMLGEGRR